MTASARHFKHCRCLAIDSNQKGEKIERREGALMISAEGQSIACRTGQKQHQKCFINTINLNNSR